MNKNLFKKHQNLLTRLLMVGMLSNLVFISLYCGINNYMFKKVTVKHFSEFNPLIKPISYSQYLKYGHEYSSNAINQNTFEVTSYHELGTIFSDTGFQLPEQRSLINVYNSMYVPRLYLVALPQDFKQASLSSKKRLFLKSLLPIVLRVNEDILKERRQLLILINEYNQHKNLSTYQRHWLNTLSVKYRLKRIDFKELKRRVDIIPPSLALSQAIVESGWGTSHSALQHNSTFGLRNHDDTHPLAYGSLTESVENYMRNINAHLAYSKLRSIRQEMRVSGHSLCSLKLAKGLLQYSTRGQSYVREISELIRLHDLKKYDNVHLTSSVSESL